MSDPTTSAAPTAAEIVAGLGRAEKVRLLSGAAMFDLEGLPDRGLAGVAVADGPHGLRHQDRTGDHLGMHASVPATCFPTAVTLGSS